MNRRLKLQTTEWIDRSKPIEFQFEGNPYTGFAGDVIASALYANGVRLTGRSFKYHRPRGCYSFAGHDSNSFFTDGMRAAMRGDLTLLADGMNLKAVNTFGSLEKDKMSIVGRFGRFMPVGFYYKTFHQPKWMFPFHEKRIRQIAGLGQINAKYPTTHSPKDYAWCDVLVVGGGPAGLGAAKNAAQTGLRVMIVDENPRLGGSSAYLEARDSQSFELVKGYVDELRQSPNVDIRLETTVGGCYGDNWVALFDEKRLTKLRAKTIVFATGAIEQPAVFGNNDLPGIMLASAAQRLMRLYAVKPFDKAVVLAANSDAYAAALDLLNAGVRVAAVVDLRPQGENGSALAKQVADAGIPIHNGYAVYEGVASKDKKSVVAATIAPLNGSGEPDLSRAARVECDGIAVSVGWSPNSSLLSQAGVRFKYDDAMNQLMPSTKPDSVFVAGRASGVYQMMDQIADGSFSGLSAAKYLGRYSGEIPAAPRHTGPAPSHSYPIFKHPKKKNFVEFDEDLHVQDFVNAHQEGYDSVELLKRYSTVGMGPSQGKLANLNAVRILAKLNGKSINETGTTTARPFYQPVPIGHLAGRRFHPMRQTPMHDWHARHNAVFFHAGDWYRPEYYQQAGVQRDDCILAEAKQVRQGLGIIDVGTLGKLSINGPDAVKFIERIYTGKFEKLAVGKTRYCVGLDESGIVMEDGVVCRLATDRFYVTATSSGAAGFYRELLRWAMIWKVDVTLSNVTGQYAAMNLAGPNSREVLAKLTDADLGQDAFPYLGIREAKVAGVPALLLRVGFVGELGYEIHVPAWQGLHVWQTLIDAGAAFQIRPFGVEAQRILRLEKGHIIITQDTDALTHPYEVGVEWALGKDKPFYIGQRSVQIINRQKLTRKLVGIRWPASHQGSLPDECHLIMHESRIAGRVTSIAKRSTQGYPLGLALVLPELAAPGTNLSIRLTDGSVTSAQVVKIPFYDPENSRQGK